MQRQHHSCKQLQVRLGEVCKHVHEHIEHEPNPIDAGHAPVEQFKHACMKPSPEHAANPGRWSKHFFELILSDGTCRPEDFSFSSFSACSCSIHVLRNRASSSLSPMSGAWSLSSASFILSFSAAILSSSRSLITANCTTYAAQVKGGHHVRSSQASTGKQLSKPTVASVKGRECALQLATDTLADSLQQVSKASPQRVSKHTIPLPERANSVSQQEAGLEP